MKLNSQKKNNNTTTVFMNTLSDAFLKSANSLVEENNKLKEQKARLTEKCAKLNEQIKSQKEKIETLSNNRPTYLELGTPRGDKIPLGLSHHTLEKVLKALNCGLNVYLYGPSGSGKTYAAKQCAKALGVELYFTGAISNEYKLTGYMDAKGEYVATEFRKAYENGGLFLFDEIDGSFPQAVLAFNAALANDSMDFPDKNVSRNEKFYCIAAANTIGLGANRQYVGRNQLDAASLDRFVFVEWDYDENLERKVAGNDEWFEYVLKVRKVIDKLNLRHIVSPRASFFGAKLLGNGFSREDVENMVLWKGMDRATIDKILEYVIPVEVKSDYKGKASFGEVSIGRSYHEERLYSAVSFTTGSEVKKGEAILNIYGETRDKCHRLDAPADGIITYKVEEGQTIEEGQVVAMIEKA